MSKYDNRIYIMSAERAGLDSRVNYMRTYGLWEDITRMELIVRPSQGYYEGTLETSVVITERDTDNLREVLVELSKVYDQDCIMVREKSGACYLLGAGKDEYIGEWRLVPKSVAMMVSSSTLVGGKHYITSKFN
tara:strand:- start:405 stop:806 length:402 start_codon:yes stop_codon:yes gene_type:complete